MPNTDNPSLEDFFFRRLDYNSSLKPFDCHDADLNDFFLNDANNYAQQLLGVTYTFEDKDNTIAFFTVLNDKIINKDSRLKIISNRLIRSIPNKKRRPSFPAVKVGRLGVHTDLMRKGLGSQILTFIKHFFTDGNKTGCRFITVDAYNNEDVINFYRKNRFQLLTDKDKKAETRLMWYDLKTFIR